MKRKKVEHIPFNAKLISGVKAPNGKQFFIYKIPQLEDVWEVTTDTDDKILSIYHKSFGLV